MDWQTKIIYYSLESIPLVQGTYETLKVEIDNIKEDVKEIKFDQKETNKHFREVIDTLTRTQVQQTEILKNQERQFAQVNQDISELKDDFDATVQTQTKWYQDFLSTNFGVVFKTLIILVLLLAGVKLAGVDVGSLLGL
jgi:predicted nuclease with TOPRIM domain